MAKQKLMYGFKILFFAILAVIIGASGGLLVGCLKTIPATDQIAIEQPKEATKVYDINGQLISNLFEENRTFAPLNKVPTNLQDAIVSIEDYRFYQHHGIDFKGIGRALWVDITGKGGLQGGSTITQQLAKNVFLTQKRTLERKIEEAFLALQLERKYTKEEILEFYLNQIYFGHGAYGVQAAAQVYFGKNIEQLDLAECALIAGLPKGPSYYSPYENWAAAKSRQATVLNRMAELGYITPEQAQEAKEEELKLPGLKVTPRVAPYFMDYLTQYLIEKYGANAVYRGGLKVYTTLDLKMQKAAEESLQNNLPPVIKDSKGIEQPQGALIALEPSTGYIKAMVGGRDFQNTQLNRASMAHRSPGSTFKPFVYIAAIDNGYSPYSIIDDAPVQYGSWRPQNYDHSFRGPITLSTALTNSVNVATIKLAEQIGIDKVKDYAQRMGIKSITPEDNNLALAIGGMQKGITPLELASAYATLANGGMKVDPTCVVKVEDRNGNTMEQNFPSNVNVLNPQTAYTITTMLQNVITSGTGKAANIGRPAAGKTGTTDDYKDAWFVGYTPDLVAAVWMGHDQPKEMPRISGGSIPARIWSSFMRKALANTPAKSFTPSGGGAVIQTPDTVVTPEQITPEEQLPQEQQPTDNQPTNQQQENQDTTQQPTPNPTTPPEGQNPPTDNSTPIVVPTQ